MSTPIAAPRRAVSWRLFLVDTLGSLALFAVLCGGADRAYWELLCPRTRVCKSGVGVWCSNFRHGPAEHTDTTIIWVRLNKRYIPCCAIESLLWVRFPECGKSLCAVADSWCLTCLILPLCTGGRPAALDHEKQDADTYAAWGVDYVKEDSCNAASEAVAPWGGI